MVSAFSRRAAPFTTRKSARSVRSEITAIEAHQRTVVSAVMHLFEVMALVCKGGEKEASSNPAEVLRWCRDKCEEVEEAL